MKFKQWRQYRVHNCVLIVGLILGVSVENYSDSIRGFWDKEGVHIFAMSEVSLCLFHRAAHSGYEIALEEQEHQHDRHYGNQNCSGKLVVLGRKLGAELNESKGERS
jgi:hypothetical protein